jgi:hypothetical protein
MRDRWISPMLPASMKVRSVISRTMRVTLSGTPASAVTSERCVQESSSPHSMMTVSPAWT